VLPLADSRQPLGWRGHLAYVRNSRRFSDELVAEWALDGLACGEQVLYAHRDGDSPRRLVQLVDELASEPVPGASRRVGEPARSAGRFEAVTLSTLSRLGAPERMLERALADEYSGLRLSADLGAAVEALGRARVEEMERVLEELSETAALSALCRLDEQSCGSSPGLLALHGSGICASALSVVAGPGEVRVSGEVDLVNEHLLAMALRAMARSGAELRIDVARLRFLSVGGARALVQATDFCRRRGGRVVLAWPPPVVLRVLTACGYDELFEFELSRAS
jgi:anti-anti-sigma factor